MKNRRTLILSILAVAIISLSAIGLSFAYFSSTNDYEESAKVNVQTSNNAYIYYDTGSEIELFANQPGYTDELEFSVKLVGDSKGTIKSVYDVNLNVDSNTFVYDPQTSLNTPELLIDVYKRTDNLAPWAKVLEDKDVTELLGVVNLVTDQEIEVGPSSEITQYWKVVIKYISLDKDQSYNMNKEFISNIKVENVE